MMGKGVEQEVIVTIDIRPDNSGPHKSEKK